MRGKNITIDGVRIGDGCPPYIVAEISANHNNSLDRAIALIDAAKECGANAVKIQTYTADTITLDHDSQDFMISEGLWAGQTLHDLYTKAHLPWEWHKPLFEHAQSIGITIFSSPFDTSAVDFLEDLNVPAYKIASFEATDLNLIEYAASTKKPLIISTGMASQDEISDTVSIARSSGCEQMCLLHCVSGYPAPSHEYNLRTLSDMRIKFDTIVGLSDHTLNNITAIAGVSLGAAIVEKHFTMNRNDGGIDDSFSLEPSDLADLVTSAITAHVALGDINYNHKTSELENLKYRRSLYFVLALNAGDEITPESVRSVRPGFGLEPKYLSDILGKRVKTDVAYGTPVTWDITI